jgi:hypothetical protein
VARLANVTGRCCARAVIPKPIAIVREVARRHLGAGLQILVAAIAGARIAFALVTLETGRHRRAQLLVTFRHADMATHAVSPSLTEVLCVVEAQMLSRLDQLVARGGARVTGKTGIRIVRLLVAADARRLVGKVKHSAVAVRLIDVGVASRARDTAQQMLAMRERARRSRAQAENASACSEAGDRDQRCEPAAHGDAPHSLVSENKISTRLRYSADDDASRAVAPRHTPRS